MQVLKNIVYNGPRAHLNHNDGFCGGTVHESNLIFNSCRESGDHGAVVDITVSLSLLHPVTYVAVGPALGLVHNNKLPVV